MSDNFKCRTYLLAFDELSLPVPHTGIVQPTHTVRTRSHSTSLVLYHGPFLGTWTFIQCDQNILLTSHPIIHFAGYAGYHGIPAAWLPTPFQSEAINSSPSSQHSPIIFSRAHRRYNVPEAPQLSFIPTT